MGTVLFNIFSAITVHPSGIILAGSDFGVFRSTDNGSSWEVPGSQNTAHDVRSFTIDSLGRIFAADWRQGIVLSIDTGKSWVPFALPDVHVLDIQVTSAGIWYAGGPGSLYRSTDGGRTWYSMSIPGEDMGSIVETRNGTLFACGDYIVLRSSDNGDSWESLRTPNDVFTQLFVDRGDRLFVGSSMGMYSSTDNGNSWQVPSLGARFVLSFYQDAQNKLYAGTLGYGVHTSLDGNIWQKSSQGLLASTIGYICGTLTGAVFASARGTMQVTRDDGQTWTALDSICKGGTGPFALAADGALFAAAYDNGSIARSTDDGHSWDLLNINVSPYFVSALAAGQGTIGYAGTSHGEVFRTTDNGDSWSKVREADGRGFVDALAVASDGAVYINRATSVFRSGNRGSTWNEVGAGQILSPIFAFVISRTGRILAGTFGGGMYSSDNQGLTWSASNSGLTTSYVSSLTIDQNGSIYAGAGRSVFRSTDQGSTWDDISSGIKASFVTRLGVSMNGYVYAGTQHYGLYRTVDQISRFVPPVTFHLSRNYPNPFNSTTAFDLSLPQSSDVTLVVHSSLGQRVSAVEIRSLDAGSHTIFWNASSLPSGVYFVTLESAYFKETRTAVLIR